jgi:hypothetical protein
MAEREVNSELDLNLEAIRPGVPEVAKDIQVAKDGVWHSLRGQKVAKDGVWKTFDAGCAVAKDGKWYALKAQTVTVTYNGNGGLPALQTKEHVIGSVLQNPDIEPYMDGSLFGGWNIQDHGLQYLVEVGGMVVNTDVTLYALWLEGGVIITPPDLGLVVFPTSYDFAYNELTAKHFNVHNVTNFTVGWKVDNQLSYGSITKDSTGFTVQFSLGNYLTTPVYGIIEVSSGTETVEVSVSRAGDPNGLINVDPGFGVDPILPIP